jgi:hypothetical protein
MPAAQLEKRALLSRLRPVAAVYFPQPAMLRFVT